MEKISKTWLKNHGFKITPDISVIYRNNYRCEVETNKHYIYSMYLKDKYIRFDTYYTEVKNKFGNKKIRRYYRFSAYNKKTRFNVENNISYYLPTIEQFKSAALTVGITLKDIKYAYN